MRNTAHVYMPKCAERLFLSIVERCALLCRSLSESLPLPPLDQRVIISSPVIGGICEIGGSASGAGAATQVSPMAERGATLATEVTFRTFEMRIRDSPTRTRTGGMGAW